MSEFKRTTDFPHNFEREVSTGIIGQGFMIVFKRNQYVTIRPELIQGLTQSFLSVAEVTRNERKQ
jgi:hypothetical protein